MRYLVAALCILFITSCQEVIVLDLNNAEPRIVIEGIITDRPGPYTVEVSRSAEFYDTNTFPPVRSAHVVISDELGNEEILTEVEHGIYQTSVTEGQRGMTYTLSVEVDDITYQAQSKIPEQRVEIDSVTFEYMEESLFNLEGFYATAWFNDPADVQNYYRINVFVNGEPYEFDFGGENVIVDDNFWLFDDKFSDGNQQEMGFPHRLRSGDAIYVEMHHLNRGTYDYYRTLVDIMDGTGVAPSNPLSNFENALGYFGAFSVTSKTEIVN